MRVAFDYQIFSSQVFGGISRYFIELARHLNMNSESSDEFLINAPLHINQYLHHDEIGVKTFGIYAPRIRDKRGVGVANRIISPIFFSRFSPEIIHETYYKSERHLGSRAPTVLTVFDMIHELFPNNFSSNDPTRKNKKYAVQRAEKIICISENTKRDLVEILGVNSARIKVIHLASSLKTPTSCEKLSFDKPVILYVGPRGGYKNFNRLMLAFASNKELKNNFTLVAFGGGKFSRVEKDAFQKLGLSSKHVQHFGGDDNVLATLYLSSSVFVYPSLYEGFGIPLLEAMSLGCPIACSDCGSVPEVVGNAAIRFDPRDEQSIGDTLVSVLRDPILSQKLSSLGQMRVKQFSWAKCAQETHSVYSEILQ